MSFLVIGIIVTGSAISMKVINFKRAHFG